jgi:hypothetical protein
LHALDQIPSQTENFGINTGIIMLNSCSQHGSNTGNKFQVTSSGVLRKKSQAALGNGCFIFTIFFQSISSILSTTLLIQ